MTVIDSSAHFRSGSKALPGKAAKGRSDILCKATTLNMNPSERTSITTGSTLSPGDSSVYKPRLGIVSSALVS